jgi:hypothetical protein
MLGFWRKPRFDPDMLSSIWVMACATSRRS